MKTSKSRNTRGTPLATAMLMSCLCLLLGGCFNEQEHEVSLDLGSVSVGDQLIDLKRAADAGAISRKEYSQAKADALSLLDTAASFAENIDSENHGNKRDNDDRRKEREDKSKDKREEDEDSGFLF